MRRLTSLTAVVPTLAFAFYALPLMAAEPHEGKAGLPQFDTALFPEQLFWLAVSFGLLYVMMAFVALPSVRRTQDNRQAVISDELAAATKANEAAKAMIVQYEKALADARAKAQATVSEIATQAAKESSDKQSKQQQQLNKKLHEAEAKIAAKRDAALRDIQGAASDLATTMIDKITGLRVKA